MVQAIRDLTELARKGGSIRAECPCGRVTIFAVGELLAHFVRKGWSDSWPGFARHLRCQNCGRRRPRVAWLVNPPPPEDDPQPPRPRFVRVPFPPPPGVPVDAWAKARDDRERRRLIRIVRG